MYNNIQHTTYSIQHTAYSIQHTAYSIQHTAYSIQHTAYSIQYTVSYSINVDIHIHFVYREIERTQIVLKPYVNNKEDTYLTLGILAAILDRLSESGRVFILGGIHSINLEDGSYMIWLNCKTTPVFLVFL
jgi:hypothetical protein